MKKRNVASCEIFLPSEFELALTELHDWLSELETTPRCAQPPTKADKEELENMFINLWTITGMDTSLGLARSTPDQKLFRDQVGSFFWQSPLLWRCFEKPLGYTGDYKMMEGIYYSNSTAETHLGKWIDAWFRDSPPFISVRNRRNMIADILVRERERGAGCVLNVACGSAPELAIAGSRIKFEQVILLDQDKEAIAAVMENLRRVSQNMPVAEQSQIKPWQCKISSLLTSSSPLENNSFDIIYSMGLYDYLNEWRAGLLTKNLWSSLLPGGLFVIGNFNGHHWARYVMEAVMDWFLVYRDIPEITDLASSLTDVDDIECITDTTGLLHLLLIRKT